MSQALGSPHAPAQLPLALAPACAALLGLAARASLAECLEVVADSERGRVATAAARALDSALVIVAIATRLRLRDGQMAVATLEFRIADDVLVLDLIDVNPARDMPRLPDAGARLAQRTVRLDAADAWAWEWDVGADLPEVAPDLARLLGYAHAASGTAAFAAALPADAAAALTRARLRSFEHSAPFAAEVELRDARGATRAFRLSGALRTDEHGVAQYLSGHVREIADAQGPADARLAQQAEEIERLGRESRELAIRIIDAQETERRHIARELHDQTGQTLTAAVLDLEFWKGKGVPADEIAGVLANVKQALAEIRNISLQLRPPMLDEAGLEAALQIYLERQAASGKFDVSFAVEGKGRLAPELELTAFRLVQEAVTNILRHAGARHVDVSLRIGTQELTLRVSDNGSGCVAQDALGSASGGMSLGLISMRERAALVGGHCEFISAPAVGSMVLARLPLRR
jgi:signal transduction histidine kinase